jgi:acyl carrier protein
LALAIVELVMALEQEFRVTINDADVEKLHNIGDLTEYLRPRIQ